MSANGIMEFSQLDKNMIARDADIIVNVVISVLQAPIIIMANTGDNFLPTNTGSVSYSAAMNLFYCYTLLLLNAASPFPSRKEYDSLTYCSMVTTLNR